MIPYIEHDINLRISENNVVPIKEFDTNIKLSDLDITNITSYYALYANIIKAETYHYFYDGQVENREYLSKFTADKLVLTYSMVPDMLTDLVSVKEIVLHGYNILDDMTLPPNVTTQIITLCDMDECMYMRAPNIFIQDENNYGHTYSKLNVDIGTSVRKITISSNCQNIMNLVKICTRPGVELCITSEHITK